MGSILIPTRMLADLSNASPHCLSPSFRSCHCLNRELPPPCLCLCKSCPSFGGWIKSHLPQETCLPLPPLNSGSACLPAPTPQASGLCCLHPPAVISWLLTELRTIKAKVQSLQVLVGPGPRGTQNKVMINIPSLASFTSACSQDQDRARDLYFKCM